MKVLVFLDDAKGMMFNHRRQSQDRILRDRIQEICTGHTIWMNRYSYKLYGEVGNSKVDEAFLEKAEADDFCIVETAYLKKVEEKIERLIVFWWNRKYPADLYLDLDLYDWRLEETKEFAGFSHDKITEEIYVRKG